MENIDQIVIYFNYESPDCDSIDCSELDFQTTTGAMVRAKSPIENGTAIADFMMLEINGVIPEYYNVYYSGFSLELDPINSASIHHPAGDIKKISVDYDSPEQMYLEPIGSFSGSFWGAYWDYGSFQMGSSGAPLYDQEKRLIGTATGTSDNCINDGLTSFGQFYEAYWHGDDLNIDSNNITDNVRAWLNHFSPNETVNYIDGREGTEYVNFGCTDSTAYNYDPEATADNGSCYGERGDINLDECVNILDMIWLTDIILGNYTPTEYETWAANVDELGYINVDDQIFLVGIILNNPLCSGGSARLLSNSYINFQGESSLTRNEDYLTEIVLSTESDIRASHFEFGLPPVEIINVYMADEFSDMTINWTVREDTLAILFYGAGGEVIPAGTHTVAMIESNIPLSRLGGQDIQYLNGVYANGDQDLISLQWGTGYFDDTVIPAEFSLHQPYPNPFNPVTKISYDLQVGSFTNISVYDLNGGLVDVLVSGFNEAGSHTIEWNAKNKSSGVYILQLNSGSFSATRKLLLLK